MHKKCFQIFYEQRYEIAFKIRHRMSIYYHKFCRNDIFSSVSESSCKNSGRSSSDGCSCTDFKCKAFNAAARTLNCYF